MSRLKGSLTSNDGVQYVHQRTTSKALHCISHSFNPSDEPPETESIVQELRGSDVFVYVLERGLSNTDVNLSLALYLNTDLNSSRMIMANPV